MAAAVAQCNADAAYPIPSRLPPRNWETVGGRAFLHGCNPEGLFNASELALAAKFAFLTVEKGQGYKLPGTAEEKMAAIAQQWKDERRRQGLAEGTAIFYLNSKLDWTMYKFHEQMESHPEWAAQMGDAVEGAPCRLPGDRTFPQPEEGMLTFNHSVHAMREAFIQRCVDATGHGFDGCFLDSVDWGRTPTAVQQLQKQCHASPAAAYALGNGTETMLRELQQAVGDEHMVIAKDGGEGTSATLVNSMMIKDTFCSCYDCTKWADYADMCQTQIQLARALGRRGQAAVLHGEVNGALVGNATALQHDFEFSLAAFLIAASDSAFFGYSNGWYYSGAEWHTEYDRPLGQPLGEATHGTGVDAMKWSRRFASGTTVELDVGAHTASIHWQS
eukprot:TRINITY_DN24701_c0_g1_i1.p1 TRINITY_DN24701_c0_g1~~TRINITY_DN24701_c0_g1_i1.p1  ORF type:complete len:412 (+),score=99.13 TRINITY_DN24701_c0_g1_i1:71-1237(+)